MTRRTFEELMVALVPLLASGRTGRLDALARASTRLLDCDHVGVGLAHGSDLVAVGTSSPLARAAHDLQVRSGEGPAIDGRLTPVRVDDLATETRWPISTDSLRALDISIIDAVPIPAAAATIGSLTCYRTSAERTRHGPTSEALAAAGPGDATGAHRLRSAEEVAAALGRTILRSGRLVSDDDGDGSDRGDPFAWLLDEGGLTAVVHQACGMVAVQIGCDMDEARTRLRARAFAEDRTTLELAREVVQRHLRLER